MRVSILLLCVLVTFVVAPSASGASPTAARATTPTTVSISASPAGTVVYQTSVSVRGQVVYVADDGDHHAVEGTVVLARRYLGTSTWRNIGTDVMSGFFPAFDFTVHAVRKAQYRVRFQGDASYGPSSGSVFVRVARKVSATVTEPRENVFFMSGRVIPSYAGRPVTLMRKTCLRCAWKVYARKAASATSRYRFRLPNPPVGATHYFRVRIPSTAWFVTSFSSTWQLTRFM